MNKETDNLDELYTKSETCDKEIFSEMRSNILLVSGDHFAKNRQRLNERLRLIQDIPSESRIKIALNHTARVCHIWEGAVHQYCPDVRVFPRNERELQDQKTAELNQSVWDFIKDKHIDFGKFRINTIQDFFRIGETHAEVFFDPDAGETISIEQIQNEDGSITEKPIKTGKLGIRRHYAFNVLRCANSQSFQESPYIILRELVDTKEIKERYKENTEIISKIQATKDETFKVFDAQKGNYSDSKDQTMVKKIYYKPSYQYPNGYFKFWITGAVLEEGELPGGIFPIISAGCDEIQTSARYRSKIKQLRPLQVEINRTISKIAETQATSDNQVWLQHGSKATPGASYPGVRTNYYTGTNPIFSDGASGSQYLDYLTFLISEFYKVGEIEEELQEKEIKSPDLYVELFKSIKQKKKFSIYSSKIEDFYKQICEVCLQYAKFYFPVEGLVIPIIGKSEFVNIEEFKNTEPNSFLIKLEEMSDDISTVWGRQLGINTALQYIGSKLERKDIGKLMSLMPFGNFEESFSDFLVEEDIANNTLLALDRGDDPMLSDVIEPNVVIRAIERRMSQSDYALLSPEIQQNYQLVRQYYIDKEAKNAAELQRAQSGFIPSSGPLVKIDYYVNVPGSIKPVKATAPVDALAWLLDKLADQQMSQEQLQSNYSQQAQVDIMSSLNGGMNQEDQNSPQI